MNPESSEHGTYLEELLRIATAEPDQELLHRYFRSIHLRSPEGSLTPEELRWVETNLNANPMWRDAWRRLENDRTGGLRMRTVVRSVAAASVILAFATIWNGILVSADLSVGERAGALAREMSGVNRSAGQVKSDPVKLDLVVGSAWSLKPRVHVQGLDSLLESLQAQHDSTDDPFQKSESAYRIAELNELSGRDINALQWYSASLESEVDEFTQAAQDAIHRIEARRDR